MADKKPTDSSMSEEDRRKKRESYLKQLTAPEDADFLQRVSKVPKQPIPDKTVGSLRNSNDFNPSLVSGSNEDIANNLFETSLQDVIRDTTYGTETQTELAKAKAYAREHGIPEGFIDKRFYVAVNPGKENFSMPGRNLVSLDPTQSLDGNSKIEKASNGFLPLSKNNEASGYHPSGVDRFVDKSAPTKMPLWQKLEHEGSHQALSGLENKILPQTTTPEKPQSTPYWTESSQLYANRPGEMLNFLSAIQRDKYAATGSRFEKPDDFVSDMQEIMYSKDPETAMSEKGFHREDARRAIRSIIASPKSIRKKMILNMSKAVPALAKSEEFSGGLLS